MTNRASLRRVISASVLLVAGVTAMPVLAGQGTLQYGQRVYYPQGCVHNGNRAVCSFVLVNQGQAATLYAGTGPSELTGISFVDNGHVPHAPDTAYFIDPFGSQQNQLFLNKNDRGLMTVEFKAVDPAVTFGEFHLRDQVLAGIAVSQPNYTTPGATGNGAPQLASVTLPPQSQPQMQTQMQPQMQPQMQQQAATPQPCVAGTSSCNAQNKMAAAQQNAAGWAGLLTSVKSIIPGGAAPVQQQPVAQMQPQMQPQMQMQTQPQVQQPAQQAPQMGLTPQQEQALRQQQAGQQIHQ